LPHLPARFEHVVDRMCRKLLGVEMTPDLLETACIAVDRTPDHIVTDGSPVATFRFAQLLVALLDTPDHMTR
jgi:hypothetical protein